MSDIVKQTWTGLLCMPDYNKMHGIMGFGAAQVTTQVGAFTKWKKPYDKVKLTLASVEGTTIVMYFGTLRGLVIWLKNEFGEKHA